MAERKYPIGIQTFSEIIEGGYVYNRSGRLIPSSTLTSARLRASRQRGRVDMVVRMPDTTYVFELKVSGTAEEALRQIDNQGYAIPYQTDSRPVVKIGVKFNADTRIPENWLIE